MSLTHSFDGRITIATLTYEPDPCDARPALEAIASDARLVGVPALIDARACAAGCPALRACERIEQVVSALSASRYAIVVGSLFGRCSRCRVGCRRASEPGREARVFYEVGGALRWLWHLDDNNASPGLGALPATA